MKRLVCSLDGTWNDDGPLPLTNVAKLHSAIPPRDRRGVRQLVRYISGIATEEGQRFNFLRGAFGFDVARRIKLGYEFLRDAYDPGDEIYLFGFSRGAYEARSLASFVTLFGIARRDADFSVDEAWDLYRQSDHKRDVDTLARLSAACHYPVRIRCVGVWDTVGSIGNPYSGPARLSRKLAFHDMRLHDTIDVVLHALAIDETRGPFRPTLFTLPGGIRLAPHQHVEQVWFPGTHADVGGGWPNTQLSDISLLWMAQRIMAKTGLKIDIAKLRRGANADALGLQHFSATGWIYAFSRRVPYRRVVQEDFGATSKRRRRWRTGRLPDGLVSINELVHDSVYARLGHTVRELRGNAVREFVYEPEAISAGVATPVQAAEITEIDARVA
jgi:uncharacterized protein (DUF2235 family)